MLLLMLLLMLTLLMLLMMLVVVMLLVLLVLVLVLVLMLVLVPVPGLVPGLLFLYKYISSRTKPKPLNVRGYRLLQQQELVNPPLKCCEIVILWKAFRSDGVPKGYHARKTAKLTHSPAHRRIDRMTIPLLRTATRLRGTRSASSGKHFPVLQGSQTSRTSRAY